MRKNIFVTMLSEGFVMVCGILVYKFAAVRVGPEGFAVYALSRRVVAFMPTFLLMGLGIGIPRYLAYASNNPFEKKPDTYFLAGLFVISIVAVIFVTLSLLFQKIFSNLVFGNQNYRNMIIPIDLMTIGLLLHIICYAYYRGKLLMSKANFFQIINIGFVPIIGFLAFHQIQYIIAFTGMGWIIISFIFLFFIRKNMSSVDRNIWPYAKKLLSYGMFIIPGEFALGALLTLPALITAHQSGTKQAGLVAFGVSIFSTVGSGFAPIGLILLPKVSGLMVKKDLSSVWYYVKKILSFTLISTTIGVLIFEMFATQIIGLYLGKGYNDLLSIARIIIVSSVPYALYVSTRSVIDAYYEKTRNTPNILVSLVVFIISVGISTFFTKNTLCVIYSFSLAIFCLGILTILELRKIKHLVPKDHIPLESYSRTLIQENSKIV